MLQTRWLEDYLAPMNKCPMNINIEWSTQC